MRKLVLTYYFDEWDVNVHVMAREVVITYKHTIITWVCRVIMCELRQPSTSSYFFVSKPSISLY